MLGFNPPDEQLTDGQKRRLSMRGPPVRVLLGELTAPHLRGGAVAAEGEGPLHGPGR